MLRSVCLFVVLAMVHTSSAVISTNFLTVSRIECFGQEIANNDDQGFTSEFDICVAGVIVGAILLIGAVPFLGGQSQADEGYGYGYDVHRRQGINAPPQFKNPADSVQNPHGFQAPQEPSLRDRLSRAFDNIAADWKARLSPVAPVAAEQQQPQLTQTEFAQHRSGEASSE